MVTGLKSTANRNGLVDISGKILNQNPFGNIIISNIALPAMTFGNRFG